MSSFQTKVTLAFIISLTLVISIGNFLAYKYVTASKFNDLKDKLLIVSRTAAIAIDADLLEQVPLNAEGVNTQAYKAIAIVLNKVKTFNPSLKYIYIIAKTDQPGVWQFIVDPEPVTRYRSKLVTSFPGDKYNASRFVDMLNAYSQPSVDRQLSVDEWGVTLSGYAPIFNKYGKAVAVLGVDIDAGQIYVMQRQVLVQAIVTLLAGILISVLLGIVVSRRVVSPVEKLVEGTRKIASGDLQHKVDITGTDEIGELASSFNEMAANLAESKRKLHEYFYRMVQSLVRSIEAKDPYTRGHSDRVGEYAGRIALEMGFSEETVELLRKAAQLHDIGKLGIHEDILTKKSSLAESEWDVVYKHPVVGEEILKPVILDDDMLSVIRSHHEHYDGTGYPDGLKGDQISMLAQIASVADAYDAMTSSRTYNRVLTKEEAIKRLKEASGTQFNPKVVEAFIKALAKEQ